MSARARTLVAGIGLAVVVVLVAQHAATRVNQPGRVDPARWGLQDFRDAVYYPVVAFLDGRNPYDQDVLSRTYPVGQSFPLYLPITLLVHLPFGLLPPAAAGSAFFLYSIALTGVIAALAIGGAGVPVTAAGVLGLTALLLASRAGHMNLTLGQVTAEVVIGSFVALRWARTRPIAAGLGLALSTLKPTYGVPLAVLMLLGRGDVAAVLTGIAASVGLCVVVLVPLVRAAGGLAAFIASLGSSAAAFGAERTSNAWTSFARIDATAVLARLIGGAPGGWTELALGLAVVGIAVAGLRRMRDDRDAPTVQLGVGLVCLTMLVATYHQTYDTLLLAQPAVALAAGRWGRGAVASPGLRWIVLGLILVPAVNYLATQTIASRLSEGSPAWLAITGANSVALLGAWAVHAQLASRTPPR